MKNPLADVRTDNPPTIGLDELKERWKKERRDRRKQRRNGRR